MKRRRPLRRTPLKRGPAPSRKRPPWQDRKATAGSLRAQRQADERKRRMREAFGYAAVPCHGAGILPTCPGHRAGWEHQADTAHEPRKRSHGADPTDPDQAMPLCFDGHRWVHDHPRQASELHAADGRAFLLLADPLANP